MTFYAILKINALLDSNIFEFTSFMRTDILKIY